MNVVFWTTIPSNNFFPLFLFLLHVGIKHVTSLFLLIRFLFSDE